LGVCGGNADTLRESYVAVLSERDHLNSSGERLTSAAAIIRQDRANFHKLGKRDPGDESDRFFADANNRELLEQLLNRGTSRPAALRAIINGTPTVTVSIYRNDAGRDYVNVVVNGAGDQVERSGDDGLVESYVAVLSEQDHLNSSGERLTSAAAIIRQDRANFHKLGKRDPGDEGDRFFASANNREILEQLLNRGTSRPAVLRAIVNGTPTVTVKIYRTASGNNYVNVTVSE
jgi:hypothetical protein